jgi:hypothetical protein
VKHTHKGRTIAGLAQVVAIKSYKSSGAKEGVEHEQYTKVWQRLSDGLTGRWWLIGKQR